MTATALIRRGVLWPFWIAAFALSILLPHGRSSLQHSEWQWTPWIIGIAVFGLPHGAQDERLLKRKRDRGLWARAVLFASYIVAAGLVLCLWRFYPAWALLSFLTLAGFHFGEGDAAWSQDFGAASRIGSPWYTAGLLLLHGALPILLPILAFPAPFAAVASALPGVSLSLNGHAAWMTGSVVGLALLTALQAAYLVQALRSKSISTRVALEEVADTFLLIILFASLQPLLSVGIYFLLAHSHRYIARRIFTLRTEGEVPQTMKAYWTRLWAFHQRTLFISVGCAACLPLLWILLGGQHWGRSQIGPTLLVALSMLTLPHALVVCCSDWLSRSSPQHLIPE